MSATFVANEWTAVDDTALDTLRGGFEMPAMSMGLAVSFSFVRSFNANGERVSETRFTLPDISSITAAQASQVSEAMAQATTAVQNNLNNQKIQTLTQIDAGINSLGILRAINSQGVLRDALLGALGVR
jgi:hypothetical protein